MDGSSSPILLIFMGLAIVGLFFMNSRARKRQAAATAFRTTLAPGQEVMTTSGMFGTVTAVDGDKVTIATAGGQESVWLLAAIAKVVEDEPVVVDDDAEATAPVEDVPPTDLGPGGTATPRDEGSR